jgi:AGZA family xanthine/uracil permease-like MFS transporter
VRAGRVPRWFAAGDWSAFCGLALDNMTQLVILSSLLIGAFRFPPDLVLHTIVPGTAVGVLVGDLIYTRMAVDLMRRTGRPDVTAMPFGIDTPSLFGITFGVLGPALSATGDPVRAWKIGMAVTVIMGLVKLVLAFAGDWVRRLVPRAALLGSIAGVAVLLIAFLPAKKVMADPLVGLVSLVVVFVALTGRMRLPLGVPGALAAVVAGTAVFWLRGALDGSTRLGDLGAEFAGLHLALPWPTLASLDALAAALPYLAVGLPFAVATVVGGIDNTESAIAAGDRYHTRDVLLTEAVATVAAGLCGGVVQNTPYIGHPAYKAMGARAGYTLLTAVAIGGGAAVGVVSLLVRLLPEAAVAPILVFIGLEIAAQAFLASPVRHAPAVAVAFIPAVAALVLIEVSALLGALDLRSADLLREGRGGLEPLLVLGNGFVVTALLWGSAVACIVDRRLELGAAALAGTGLLALFGVVHSPRPDGAVFWPWAAPGPVPFALAGAYGLAAGVLLALGAWRPARRPGQSLDDRAGEPRG